MSKLRNCNDGVDDDVAAVQGGVEQEREQDQVLPLQPRQRHRARGHVPAVQLVRDLCCSFRVSEEFDFIIMLETIINNTEAILCLALSFIA